MDVTKMMAAKAATVKGLTGGIEHLLKKHKVDYLKGQGRLTGPHGVAVDLSDGGTTELATKNGETARGIDACHAAQETHEDAPQWCWRRDRR